MFYSGRFRLAGRLPARRLDGVVRWPDGATQRLPLLDARTAFSELATPQPFNHGYTRGQLTVTGARPGTVTAATSRGLARIPAWQFTVAGLSWPVSQIAVAPRALTTLTALTVKPPGPVAMFSGVSADGRGLTVQLPAADDCITAYGAWAYETAGAVVVGGWWAHSHCPGVSGLVISELPARITLARPLGTRVILDVATGLPLRPMPPLLAQLTTPQPDPQRVTQHPRHRS